MAKDSSMLTKEERAERAEAIISDYESGFLLDEIKEKHNISKQGIYYILGKLGNKTERRYGNPVSVEDVNKIIEMYNNGDTVQHISKILTINHSKVSKVLHDNGVSFRVFKVDPVHLDEIKERYLSGETADSISKDYDCCAFSITNYLKKVGVESRKHIKKITPDNSKKIYKMYKDGVLFGKIAKTYGISVTAVYYHIKKQESENGYTAIS